MSPVSVRVPKSVVCSFGLGVVLPTEGSRPAVAGLPVAVPNTASPRLTTDRRHEPDFLKENFKSSYYKTVVQVSFELHFVLHAPSADYHNRKTG